MSILLNGLPAISARLTTPWLGAWFADVELDMTLLPPGTPIPPGPAVLVIGTTTLIGFIDSAAQGTFAAKGGARVIGGRNGWAQPVPCNHFHNDAGLLTNAEVIAATAGIVGEVAVVPLVAPVGDGVDYIVSAGPASQVLAEEDWHVDVAGVTQVAPRPPLPLDPLSFEVVSFDPIHQVLVIATDDIVTPGAIVVNPLFGTVTVRDVEQHWTAKEVRATCYCGPSRVSRAQSALKHFVEESIGVRYLKTYRYRVVLQGVDGRLVLQPVNILGPMPPTLPLSVWPGMAGLSAKYAPTTEVLVAFAEGDPARPIVIGFAPDGVPLELDVNALAISLGLGLQPIALATSVLAALGALQTEVLSLNALLLKLVVSPGIATLIATDTALQALITAQPALMTAQASALSTAEATLPSVRTRSD